MHYSLAVITKDFPTKNVIKRVMAPFSEIDKNYLQNISVLEKMKTEYPDRSTPDFLKAIKDHYGFPTTGIGYVELCRESNGGDYIPAHEHGWIVYSGEQYKVIDVINRHNPHGRWDWYHIGGRWSNLLLTSNGSCDSCQLKDLDYLGKVSQLEKEAHQLYNLFEKTTEGLPRKWKAWNELCRRDGNYTDKVDIYHNQPIIERLSNHNFPCDYDLFLFPRDEFVKRWSSRPFQTFSVLIEAELETPHKGWYTLDPDSYFDSKATAMFNELIQKQSSDHYITIIDYHN